MAPNRAPSALLLGQAAVETGRRGGSIEEAKAARDVSRALTLPMVGPYTGNGEGLGTGLGWSASII